MATERILAKLWATIESRRSDPTVGAGLHPQAPFNTRELLQNPSKLRKKFNEEAYELNEAHQAALAGHEVDIGLHFGARDHVAREAADVLWHLYVLLASVDVTPKEVYAVLERRHAKDLERQRRLAKDAAAHERVLAESGEPAALDETPPAETEREPVAAPKAATSTAGGAPAPTAPPQKPARVKPASAAKPRRGK